MIFKVAKIVFFVCDCFNWYLFYLSPGWSCQ